LKTFKNKIFAIFLILIFIFILTSCSENDVHDAYYDDNGKLKIIATLFPQYDFARQIAGDKADVKLLLPPGVESHSFDPKPNDMLEIYNADLFIYTGENMEPWAENILKGAKNDHLAVLNCAHDMTLIEDDDHEHGADPHIWLNPVFAQKIVGDIMRAICAIDPDNMDFYKENAKNYMEKLKKLDGDIFDAVYNADAKRNVVVFGGRFAYLYFLTRYNLDYVTAYDSCSSQAEPSVSKIAEVIDFIKQNNIPCIYYEELSDPKVAKTIAKETGAECLLFSTAHNVTKSEFDGGKTFLDIMYENLENLKKGLN